MIQAKMFFKALPEELEESVQKWLEVVGALITDVLAVSQCEHTDPKTNVRGVLLTIVYQAARRSA
jgi:hypothetical protein